MDSGIDVEHPDLKEAMWSDGNGNHGYNFFAESNTLNAGYHGTHVAGTVGARSNNGIGVSGVAGGDGSKDSGVRLMSCQIFGPNKKTEEQMLLPTTVLPKHSSMLPTMVL